MSNTYYILAKDLPDVKCGAIFKLNEGLAEYFFDPPSVGVHRYTYKKEFVENSDWFKPMPKKIRIPIDSTFHIGDRRVYFEEDLRKAFYAGRPIIDISDNPKQSNQAYQYETFEDYIIEINR